MRDTFSVRFVRKDAGAGIYPETDPAQQCLRRVLGALSECELAELDRDIELFALTGDLSRRLEALLHAAEERPAKVA